LGALFINLPEQKKVIVFEINRSGIKGYLSGQSENHFRI